MEKLVIERRSSRKNKQTSVTTRINIDTYQKIEKPPNECNYTIVEMIDTLIDYAVKNLEVKE